MPVYKQSLVLDAVRGVKAFLKLEAGLTRSYEIAHRPLESGKSSSRLDQSKVVWLFGTGRSGSTWLMNMMAGLPDATAWNEPMVGKLFGDFYENANKGQLGSGRFILGNPNSDDWEPLVRDFVLRNAELRFPAMKSSDYLIVKEPNASVGASVLSRAMPESRMVLLVRDPRDVVSSVLDGAKEGSWLYERKRGTRGLPSAADADPDEYVLGRARMYRNHMDAARKGYDAHPGPRAVVRYEDLRSDALSAMTKLYADLGIAVDERLLARSVEEQAWENIPEEQKGDGKKTRKATPGGWQEDLTPEQARTVEEITSKHLEAYYSS